MPNLPSSFIFLLFVEYGCSDDPSQNCLAYAGCETLVSTPQGYIDKENQKDSNSGVSKDTFESKVDVFVAALQASCSPSALQTLEGIQQCHDKCQTHLCCFTDDDHLGNCENVHVDACAAYAPCKALVTPHDENALVDSVLSDDVAASVKELCQLPDNTYDVDRDWVMGCHNICAPRLCCLLDANIGSNCLGRYGADECDAYEPCEVLISHASGNEVTDPNVIIKDHLVHLGIDDICNENVDRDERQFDL